MRRSVKFSLFSVVLISHMFVSRPAQAGILDACGRVIISLIEAVGRASETKSSVLRIVSVDWALNNGVLHVIPVSGKSFSPELTLKPSNKQVGVYMGNSIFKPDIVMLSNAPWTEDNKPLQQGQHWEDYASQQRDRILQTRAKSDKSQDPKMLSIPYLVVPFKTRSASWRHPISDRKTPGLESYVIVLKNVPLSKLTGVLMTIDARQNEYRKTWATMPLYEGQDKLPEISPDLMDFLEALRRDVENELRH